MKYFSSKDTLTVKGAAIIMMLIHHCFRTGAALSFDKHNIICAPFTRSQVTNIADFGKMCVPLFAFLSGYGLYLSLRSSGKRSWCPVHLIKTLSGFWCIVIVQWVYYLVTSDQISRFYFKEGKLRGCLKMTAEFFGLSDLLGFKTLDGGWWYMGTAVFFIAAAPLLFYAVKKAGAFSVLMISCLIPYVFKLGFLGNHPLSFLPVFCVGICFAEYSVFDRIGAALEALKKRSVLLFIVYLLAAAAAVLASYKLYTLLDFKNYFLIKYMIVPTVVIVFLATVICRIPYLKTALGFLGKHSYNIYLIHLLIRSRFNDIIYAPKHWLLITAALLTASLAVSLAVEGIKHLTRYGSLIGKLTAAVQKTDNYNSEKEVSL